MSLQFIIPKCRIEKTKFSNGKHFSIIAVASDDPFDKPNVFSVTSDESIGSIGSQASLKATVTGFVRSKPYKDKDTGENKIFEESNVFLNVLPFVSKQA